MRPMQELRIVVASPEDVTAERDTVETIAAELNDHMAREKGIQITVTRWDTDTTPGFDPNSPQFWIAPALNMAGCDLFVGIFWKRFGTPVRDAGSGTEQEFNTAFEAWKQKGEPQMWFYFSEQSYTPRLRAELEQWGEVLDFKDRFPAEGLYWNYSDVSQFESLLREHLMLYLTRFPSMP